MEWKKNKIKICGGGVHKKIKILSRTSEVRSLTNHLGSGQRRDTDYLKFKNIDYLKFKNIDHIGPKAG